jgi:TonB family protein
MKVGSLAAALLLCLVTGAVAAEPPYPNGIPGKLPARPPPPPWPEGVDVVKDPVWKKRPRATDVERTYPRDALSDEAGGRAILRCQFGNDGHFTRCGIAAESSTRYRFGDAAMKMAPIFEAELNDKDGRPVAGRAIDIDLFFMLN